MLDQSSNIIHRYPGNIITVAGSKKKIPEKFSRPWQARIPEPNPTKCPFHKETERASALQSSDDREGERWFVLDSLFAPEKPHRLIIPDTCWEEEKMRTLGGLKKIEHAFGLASSQLGCEIEEQKHKLWGFSIQVGPLAAQNVPHCHYHLYRPKLYRESASGKLEVDPDPDPTQIALADNPALLVEEMNNFSITAGGQFTGQLFIVPTEQKVFASPYTAAQLAEVVSWLVELYASKFRSVEGLAPDYRWEFEIHDDHINFGIFVPKLNNTGTLEDMADIDRRRGRNLLWSHEETARYLSS